MAEHPNAPRCHHVRTNGLRCGSPAMRNQKLCYFHKRAQNPSQASRTEMPNLEDGNAIQLGIATIMRQLMMGGIEYRAAQLMIDSYRLALRNLKNLSTESCWKEKVITVDPAFDSQNAGAATEPLTAKELKDFEEELAEIAPQAAAIHTNDSQQNERRTALFSSGHKSWGWQSRFESHRDATPSRRSKTDPAHHHTQRVKRNDQQRSRRRNE